MIHTEEILCPSCSSNNLVKHGKSENKTQRWRCNSCKKSFQKDYTYNAHKPGVKEQILELALNGSGVRDTGRILKISRNTVTADLKKKSLPK